MGAGHEASFAAGLPFVRLESRRLAGTRGGSSVYVSRVSCAICSPPPEVSFLTVDVHPALQRARRGFIFLNRLYMVVQVAMESASRCPTGASCGATRLVHTALETDRRYRCPIGSRGYRCRSGSRRAGRSELGGESCCVRATMAVSCVSSGCFSRVTAVVDPKFTVRHLVNVKRRRPRIPRFNTTAAGDEKESLNCAAPGHLGNWIQPWLKLGGLWRLPKARAWL